MKTIEQIDELIFETIQEMLKYEFYSVKYDNTLNNLLQIRGNLIIDNNLPQHIKELLVKLYIKKILDNSSRKTSRNLNLFNKAVKLSSLQYVLHGLSIIKSRKILSDILKKL